MSEREERVPGEFRVGDRVRMNSRRVSYLENPPEGTEGVVVQVRAGGALVVDYAGSPGMRPGRFVRGGHVVSLGDEDGRVPSGCGRIVHRDYVELVEAVTQTTDAPAEPRPIRVGDLVRYVGPRSVYSEHPPLGVEGIVRCEDPQDGHSVAVDFAQAPGARRGRFSWQGQDTFLWDCEGYAPSGMGRFIPRASLALVEETRSEKPFYLVALRDGAIETLPGEDFDDGPSAGRRAAQLARELGCKVQPRPRQVEDWRAREARRLTDGTYRTLPPAWDLTPIPDHFLHLSKREQGRLAFTGSEENGVSDTQTTIRPGAYVKRFYPSLDDRAVERYGALIACDGQLKFAHSSDEIVEIYKRGPGSCMNETRFSELPAHPVSVYGAGDLALAYLEEDGTVIARVLCWPERKLFSRAYGDIAKIKAQLQAQGYSQGNLFDAKIKKIPFGRGSLTAYVMPYIDEAHSVYGSPAHLCFAVHADHCRISRYGYEAGSTGGYVYEDSDDDCEAEDNEGTFVCDACDESYDDDDATEVYTTRHGSRFWCPDCASGGTFRCDGTHRRYCDDRVVDYRAYDGSTWSEYYLDDVDGFVCGGSGDAYPGSMRVSVTVDEDGATETWGQTFFDEEGFICAGDGRAYSRDVPHESLDGRLYAVANLPKTEIETETETETADDTDESLRRVA